MFDLRPRAARSRAWIVGVVTGAAVLALPGAAAAQVPLVDRVVGGVTDAADSVAQEPLPLPGPAAPLPPPTEPRPGLSPETAAAAPRPSGPAAAPRPSGPAAAPGANGPPAAPRPSGPAAAPRPNGPAAVPGANGPAAAPRPLQGAGQPPSARTSVPLSPRTEGGEEASAAQAGGEAEQGAEPAADASGADDGLTEIAADMGNTAGAGVAAALPFTGLQLALIASAGLAALAGGALLRRVTPARPATAAHGPAARDD